MKYHLFILLPCVISFCLCEITEEKKTKLLSDFINYYNYRPNVAYKASDGFLRSISEIDETTYQIEVSFRAKNDEGSKMMKCSAPVEDLDDRGIALVNNILDCEELKPSGDAEVTIDSVEVQTERSGTVLENEEQTDPSITSGEQFIAIPRRQPNAPCVGCASHVNPQAQGVQDLAHLGVRHLDLHEPSVRHSLESVIDVERQVQVVNGIRYILTLSVNFNNCTEIINDICKFTKTCKISILVKPWQTLPSGAKYRAILSNNCTEEWLFGDNGEVLPDLPDNRHNEKQEQTSADNDVIQSKREENVQSLPSKQKTLSVDELKTLEDQILSVDPVHDFSEKLAPSVSETNKDHIKSEATQRFNENSVPTESTKYEESNLSQDKKKSIDEMLEFLNFSGYKPKVQSQAEVITPRLKRSYDDDLQVLSLTDDYRHLKQSLENAKFVYQMAQAMVDHLNVMDLEVKNRAVKNVVKAEEEEDNDRRFIYLQAQIVIPCDTLNCDPKDNKNKICNGVLDSTNKQSPQVLYSFCYVDNKEMESLAKEVESDDPIVLRLSKEALNKIEFESTDRHAMTIKKIEAANTHLASSRLTKISMIVSYLNCSKSVPLVSRKKCTTVEYLGTKICEVLIHERQWMKDKTITYTCTERPMDMVITKDTLNKNVTVEDPKVSEILQDALQYLEMQSSKKNKQKIVKVSNIFTQIVAGFVIKIDFVVGYTNCTDNDLKSQSSKCELLRNERLRRCKAQVWDRSWIVDGRQIEVSCDEDAKVGDSIQRPREKRDILFVGTEQPRTNNKNIDVSDAINKHEIFKRQILGGEIKQNPNDPQYLQLAQESLEKYVSDSGHKQPLSVLRIEKVTTQVVSGSMTRIHFVVAPTDSINGEFKCFSKIWEQPWLNNKQINVSCEIENHRSKRQLPGGESEQNPNDPRYLQLAQESLEKYVSDSGNKQPLSVLRIEKVTTQVVSGSMTRIHFVVAPTDSINGKFKCFSKIWEQPWLNNKQINVSCEIENHRSKRQLPGGESEQNPNDPRYLQLAQESLEKYVSDSGNKQPLSVLRIEKVTTQVVSGFMTRIHFVVAPTDSINGEFKCFSKIWEQPWLNNKQINVSCEIENHRSKRQLPGGESEQNPNDPRYLQLAQESLEKYVSDSGNKQPLSVLRIEKVTTQVVSGSMTRIHFVVAPTDSINGEFKCFSKIWEQPWLNNKQINVLCEIENHRSKRQLPGGESEQNPNDPQYLQLAQESLEKYVSDSGKKQPLSVLRIEKVTTQVVSGSMTRIHFVVASTDSINGEFKCFSKIWEQPWLNNKQINVSCEIENHRSKRQLPGGESEQNPNDPRNLQLAQESLEKYVSDSGNKQPLSMLRIEKVTTQVVSGSMTRIHFVVAPTDSINGEFKCFSKIWEQPWLNNKQINVSCEIENHRSKRQLPGGESEQNPNDLRYLQLAQESLEKYVSDSGNKQPLSVLRIEKVTTQVVSGSMTRIHFVVASTDSINGEFKCFSKIWEQPWLNNKQINVSCEIENHRSKRQLLGGESEQNPNDPQYLQLAQESLEKYVSNSGNKQALLVLLIEKVTTQVVSGSMTRIHFVVAPTDSINGEFKCFSKIWEQPWLNNKQIDVSCEIENHRSKRQFPGGESEQNPNDPRYLQLAQESLEKYVSDSGNKQPLLVLRIEKVTTQVVSGSMTRIHFVVAPTDSINGEFKCFSKIWEQLWLNNKQINVSCEIENHRSKRQLPGGESEQNPNDPRYLQLAQESLEKYVSDSGNKQPLSMLRIEKVTTQVVSGSMTRIHFVVAPTDSINGEFKCFSKIWEQPWLNNKQINVSCEIENHRSKRQLPGGESEQNPNDPRYLQLAQESLEKYVSDSGNKQPLSVLRIEKVTTQVVSGSMTRIHFVVASTDSINGEFKCFSKIWEQPWLNNKQINVSCEIENHRSKRQLPGGESEQNPNDPRYLQLAQESLEKYVSDSGNKQPLSVLRIEKVTTQVVSGSMTRIHFVVASTDSINGEFKCFSKIWEQPWLNNKQINVSCEMENHRSKRQLPGGESEQNPNDPQYLQLAQESLEKYVSNSGNKQALLVLRIEKVTTQVVSGSMTRIHFVVAPTDSINGEFKCFSKIWEQPWLNNKQIDVSCEIENHRSKRQLPGGESEQNPNDPRYLQLAQESLEKYVSDSGNKQPLSVLRIVKVTTQVVSGSMTRIHFVVAPTDSINGEFKCFSKIWEQPWLNNKQINVSCEMENHRSKRQLPGGESEQNPNDPQYLQLAQESLEKYVSDSGNKQPLSVLQIEKSVADSQNIQPHSAIRIEKVTTEVVEGPMTRINFIAASTENPNGDVIKCVSTVWEQPYINNTEIDLSCTGDNYKSDRETIDGEKEQNPKDQKYTHLAQQSLQKFVATRFNNQPHSVLQVQKVNAAVVMGSMTKIYFVADLTETPRSAILKCFSKIWQQPWQTNKKIYVSCEISTNPANTHSIENNFTEENTSNAHYLQLASESLKKFLTDNNNTEAYEVAKVEKVTAELIARKLTSLNFMAVSMNVSKSDVLKCYSEVQEELNSKNEVIKVSCQLVYTTIEDLKYPTYLQWANESLQKYLSDTDNNRHYNVVRLEDTFSEGSFTKIVFVARSTENPDELLNCVSLLISKVWTTEKKIEVNCESVTVDVEEKWNFVNESSYKKYELNEFKPESQLLAIQSLREYSKHVEKLYKLYYVNRVIKIVGDYVVYNIQFNAFPTECYSNVSVVRGLTCNVKNNIVVDCRAKIIDQPKSPKRKIHVQCDGLEDRFPLSDSGEETTHESEKMPSAIEKLRKLQEKKAQDFAEEALQTYLSSTETKYDHKILAIHSFNEELVDDRIEFSMSLKECLRYKLTSTNSTKYCPLKGPRIVYFCNAKRNPNREKYITVTCNRLKMSKSNSVNRSKRQINPELIDDADNDVDEDTMYYYAKAAVSEINTRPANNNMYKLVTIYAVKSTVQMKAEVVKMFIEVAETYCVKYQSGVLVENCEEMEGLNHRLCLARIYPELGDELVIRHVNVVCDDDEITFNTLTGLNIFELLRLSLEELERKPEYPFKLVHQGEPQLIPTLEAKNPFKLNFVIAVTNCSKNVDLDSNPYQCYLDETIPSKSCSSLIWLETATRTIKYIIVDCNNNTPRQKRFVDIANLTADSAEIKDLVAEALQKLEMSSLHRYKQRVLHINSYSSKITSGKVTTIDFDVAYTSCLKYEWVENITSCDIIDHLPRRHCIAQIWERLWINNGRNINVTCEDDETPLEAHIEFESAEMAMQLAQEALKHIEAKYPNPRKQKVVRIFSLEKQIVAGIHYKMKVEVGFTNCLALNVQDNCTLDDSLYLNKFCRVNVWVRPWVDHPPNFRVICDFQETHTSELYHRVQAEQLFYNFIATYNPTYANDYNEFKRRFEIFRANVKKIHELNVYEKGTATYGITRFADLTYNEFKARYMGLNINLRDNSQLPMKAADIPNVKLPVNFDWREFDCVTEVKDQGSCGSSWAFSAIANIEGQWRMQSGQLVALSEQELLDCDTSDNACGGGLPEYAYRMIEELGGLETENNYPYEGEQGKCLFNKTMARVKINGAVNITSNETAMAQWLVQNGPISVGLNGQAMQFYLGGISHPFTSYCNASAIDHAALIIGYSVKEYPAFHKKLPYWIVKNSWGKSWGELGYYRIYRGAGACGIDRMATSAFIPSM